MQRHVQLAMSFCRSARPLSGKMKESALGSREQPRAPSAPSARDSQGSAITGWPVSEGSFLYSWLSDLGAKREQDNRV